MKVTLDVIDFITVVDFMVTIYPTVKRFGKWVIRKIIEFIIDELKP